jgi:hypothetical protein
MAAFNEESNRKITGATEQLPCRGLGANESLLTDNIGRWALLRQRRGIFRRSRRILLPEPALFTNL